MARRPVPPSLRVGAIGLASSLAAALLGAIIIASDPRDPNSDGGPNVLGVLLCVIAGIAILVFAVILIASVVAWLIQRDRTVASSTPTDASTPTSDVHGLGSSTVRERPWRTMSPRRSKRPELTRFDRWVRGLPIVPRILVGLGIILAFCVSMILLWAGLIVTLNFVFG